MLSQSIWPCQGRPRLLGPLPQPVRNGTATCVNRLPTSVIFHLSIMTAERFLLGTKAVLLEQPETDASLGPVGRKARRSTRVEDPYALLDFAIDDDLGFHKQSIEVFSPLKWCIRFE
jgi:hypothetical protein